MAASAGLPWFFRWALGVVRFGRGFPLARSLATRPRAAGSTPKPGATATTIRRDRDGLRPGTRSYTVTGPHQQGPNKIEVLCPDCFRRDRSYSVVYLLPVNTGTDGRWGSGIDQARRGNLQNRHQVIFVAPAFDSVPWYGDNPLRPEVRQSAYILDVVVPFVDREFPTIAGPSGRSLVGFSKSGLGALSLFLRRPDLFGQVAAFDPAIAPTARNFLAWKVVDSCGTRENFDRFDPLPLLTRRRLELQDPSRRVVLLAGGPGARLGADQYRGRLVALGVPFIFILGSNMAHTWTSGWLPLAIAALAPEAPVADRAFADATAVASGLAPD